MPAGHTGAKGDVRVFPPRQKKIYSKKVTAPHRAIFETFLPFSMEEVDTHVCWWDWSIHSKTHTILSLSLKERWVWISQEIKNACWAHRGQGGCEGVFTLPTPRQKKILEKGNRSSYGRAIFETFLPFSMEEVHTHVCWWDWCVYTLQLGVLAHIHKVSVW